MMMKFIKPQSNSRTQYKRTARPKWSRSKSALSVYSYRLLSERVAVPCYFLMTNSDTLPSLFVQWRENTKLLSITWAGLTGLTVALNWLNVVMLRLTLSFVQISSLWITRYYRGTIGDSQLPYLQCNL